MKISYQWLCELVDLDQPGLSVSELAAALTGLGFAVEDVEQCGEDHILDLDVTTNRPDCLNHLGVARELAAQYGLTLSRPDFSTPPPEGQGDLPEAKVILEDAGLCPRYAARLLTGVRIGESPDWLKRRLEALGQRPVNNVVDATNYVLLEIGHPLHAFDYEKLEGGQVVVRSARRAEKLTTLDGIERLLDPSMTVICDLSRPVALAGIMGGQESEISAGTRTLLLESAYFDPYSIRRTSKKLGLRTEASFRFERGADCRMPVKALSRTCRLIQEIAGGHCAGGLIDEYPSPIQREPVLLRPERIARVLGARIEEDFVVKTLSTLEFHLDPSAEGGWRVTVPSFRVDAALEEDLVEEVARHYGYGEIASRYPRPAEIGGPLPTDRHDRRLIGTLVGMGFWECYNYVFTNPAREQPFWAEPPGLVQVSNPLTEEDTHLRKSLVPGLVETLRRNLNHGNRDVRLFELGKAFFGEDSGGKGGISEQNRLALLASGAFYQPFWNTTKDQFNFLHLKGVVGALFRSLGREVEFYSSSDVPFLHPRATARIREGGRELGFLGELRPDLREFYKFLQPVWLAEIPLEELYRQPLPQVRYRELGRFPSVQRDLSFVVDKRTEYTKIVSAVEGLGLPDLRSIQLLDLYQGPGLPEGKLSLTLRLTFVHPEKTLTQEEVNGCIDRVSSVLLATFSAELRT